MNTGWGVVLKDETVLTMQSYEEAIDHLSKSTVTSTPISTPNATASSTPTSTLKPVSKPTPKPVSKPTPKKKKSNQFTSLSECIA